MKLRSLTLTNLRKFAGQTASITGIEDGVSVVAEANEFGKSTFFDALHALFFLKYGAATREVKSLQPPSGGAVRVAAVVELATGRFEIEKTYLAQKRAVVRDAAGTTIALDDEAERWIAALLGSGLDGPAGLLWVRQGVTALEPAGNTGADKSEKERLLGARQSLLSSVAGEIDMVTGGRRMDRVIDAANTALARLATPTGQPRAGGPWKQAEVEAQTHAARHADLARICTELSQALAARREVAQQLAVLGAPDMQAGRTAALEHAEAAHTAALAHADKMAQAENQHALRALELETAARNLDALDASAQAHKQAQDQLADAAQAQARAQTALDQALTRKQDAQTGLEAATDARATAVAAKEAAQQDALRRNAADTHARLSATLAQVVEKRAALEGAEARLATLPLTAQTLAQLEQAHRDLQHAQAEAAAGGVTLALDYDGTARISAQGGALAAGTHALRTRQVFDLPGIGRMTLDPGAQAGDLDAVRAATGTLDAALAAAGVADLAGARTQAAARKSLTEEAATLASVLATLAPEGIEALQAATAQARAALDAMTQEAGTAAPQAPAALARAAQQATTAEATARAGYDAARDAADAARAAHAHADATAAAARNAADIAAAGFGDSADFEARKTAAARAHATAQVAAADALAAVGAVRAQAPDLETAQADLARARSAFDNARDTLARLHTRSADLSATIRTRAEDSVEEQRDEALGLMEAAQARADSFAHEVAGLRLLIDALRAKRGAAQEAYFGPVQQELAPLLSLLHADAALSFDPASMLPQGMARGGVEEPVGMLSGGTQEQIAILTRLAFARLFARQGKPMPVILDDALVYSDDSRITAMFTALHRVARDQQVIVFSCRQMAFGGLGGARPLVEVRTTGAD